MWSNQWLSDQMMVTWRNDQIDKYSNKNIYICFLLVDGMA